MVIQSKVKNGKIYLFISYLFTLHSLVQLLLPVVKVNGVSQPVSIEYKMLYSLNQAVSGTQTFGILILILDLSIFFSNIWNRSQM